jgi:hypothetical protein
VEFFFYGGYMPEQLPALDASSTQWLDQAYKAAQNSKFCTMPQKYFDVLRAWGYIEGTPTAAKITGKGLSQALVTQEAEKSARKKKK